VRPTEHGGLVEPGVTARLGPCSSSGKEPRGDR